MINIYLQEDVEGVGGCKLVYYYPGVIGTVPQDLHYVLIYPLFYKKKIIRLFNYHPLVKKI